ncbi:hypothetical protein CEUSTIGMA_g6571.t1 [Chlamydomonas eustigma]|uniref:Peptidase M3A/M3B catalytic domain-containing protein n=1 Tax=Chlamydomonas eustigma TaxID=1157962 RepID=A0A250X7R4_9CHLO|nr:hypothetical protein CEUSTIGMA_g6571.t1 [Chlamydomonas eustigma]|eukprot:GAX79131.1 hypothetical protein CEUSTIGMA_g6571.t1 [Chlamydomonas eustigma]
MDDLSDQLCQAYDAAECCRNVHPDPAWKQTSSQVCVELAEYISVVNQDRGLYDKLSMAMQRYAFHQHQNQAGLSRGHLNETPSVASSNTNYNSITRWSSRRIVPEAGHESKAPLQPLSTREAAAFDPETVLVGSKLLMDMEKAGIHLPHGSQMRMQELMNKNQHFSMAFNSAIISPGQLGSVALDYSRLPNISRDKQGMLAKLGAAVAGHRRHSRATVALDSPSIHNVMINEADGEIRKQVYLAGAKSPISNLKLLDEMIHTRAELAHTVGCSSYSEYKAVDASLAQDPVSILHSLEQISEAIKPLADEEMKLLTSLKGGGKVEAWDVEHLMARARSIESRNISHKEISQYLNLGSILEGFKELMRDLFELKIEIALAPSSETWAPGILKMTAELPNFGPIGTVYLDLTSRAGKHQGAVTFPIKCGRSLSRHLPQTGDDEEVDKAVQSCEAAYQLPIMALLADFGSGDPNSLTLSYRELRTLLHELGHCCHNLASRTRYQHLWGTRCAQDMVEVPSHLWEHWAVDTSTLRVLARHRSGTRDPLPEAAALHLLKTRRMFSAVEMQNQVLLSLVDQHYFGPQGTQLLQDIEVDVGLPITSHTWHSLAQRHSSVSIPDGIHPQLRVSHLTVYGGTYYSYIYARVLSGSIWNEHFSHNPKNREAGKLVWEQLLKPGGSVEPVHLLSGLQLPSDTIQQVKGSRGWAPNTNYDALKRAMMTF